MKRRKRQSTPTTEADRSHLKRFAMTSRLLATGATFMGLLMSSLVHPVDGSVILGVNQHANFFDGDLLMSYDEVSQEFGQERADIELAQGTLIDSNPTGRHLVGLSEPHRALGTIDTKNLANLIWPGGIVPWGVRYLDEPGVEVPADDTDHTPEVLQALVSSVNSVATMLLNQMDIRLERVDPNNLPTSWVRVSGYASGGCSSSVGKYVRVQTLNLGSEGCRRRGVAVHEFLHAMGMFHEHTNTDRDDYVVFHRDRVVAGREHNFDRREASTSLGVPYDYNSVMHYSSMAFAKVWSEPTLTSVDEDSFPTSSIGSKNQLMGSDIVQVQALYHCQIRRGRGGTIPVADTGESFGPRGVPELCSPGCPCAEGQGHCRASRDCQSGLTCVEKFGTYYHKIPNGKKYMDLKLNDNATPISVCRADPSAPVQPTKAPTPDVGEGQVPPTLQPTKQPTKQPTSNPTFPPTKVPTAPPTKSPTAPPTKSPTQPPTKQPTQPPTKQPTQPPTKQPTQPPTKEPTSQPTKEPTAPPTKEPTREPTKQPTREPTKQPTREPTKQPTREPTKQPTREPTKQPTREPTKQPTGAPTKQPTNEPTKQPTGAPTKQPTSPPTKVTGDAWCDLGALSGEFCCARSCGDSCYSEEDCQVDPDAECCPESEEGVLLFSERSCNQVDAPCTMDEAFMDPNNRAIDDVPKSEEDLPGATQDTSLFLAIGLVSVGVTMIGVVGIRKRNSLARRIQSMRGDSTTSTSKGGGGSAFPFENSSQQDEALKLNSLDDSTEGHGNQNDFGSKWDSAFDDTSSSSGLEREMSFAMRKASEGQVDHKKPSTANLDIESGQPASPKPALERKTSSLFGSMMSAMLKVASSDTGKPAPTSASGAGAASRRAKEKKAAPSKKGSLTKKPSQGLLDEVRKAFAADASATAKAPSPMTSRKPTPGRVKKPKSEPKATMAKNPTIQQPTGKPAATKKNAPPPKKPVKSKPAGVAKKPVVPKKNTKIVKKPSATTNKNPASAKKLAANKRATSTTKPAAGGTLTADRKPVPFVKAASHTPISNAPSQSTVRKVTFEKSSSFSPSSVTNPVQRKESGTTSKTSTPSRPTFNHSRKTSSGSSFGDVLNKWKSEDKNPTRTSPWRTKVPTPASSNSRFYSSGYIGAKGYSTSSNPQFEASASPKPQSRPFAVVRSAGRRVSRSFSRSSSTTARLSGAMEETPVSSVQERRKLFEKRSKSEAVRSARKAESGSSQGTFNLYSKDNLRPTGARR